MQKRLSSAILSMSLLCFSAHAEETVMNSQTESCGNACQSMRVSARHIENKGIGYNTGYTTLETFIAAPPGKFAAMPFLDLRGHAFNNGKWAANAGIGVRALKNHRTFGVYTYYDYRNTSHKNYNQISFGVETLGTVWDLRANGYVVLGEGQSNGFNRRFKKFSGNTLLFSERIEYGLSGGNGELGFYPLKMKNIDLYTSVGPYYLKGTLGSSVWGGQFRTKAMWKNYLGAEITYSYDHLFRNIVQGQAFFSYPFGPKSKIRPNPNRSCADSRVLYQRLVEPVMKNEIIPVNSQRFVDLAINPATGQPYRVWFVNNLSHSAGTYESPFSTLLDAQHASSSHDLIYVFPRDMTSTGLNAGIQLQNGQQLLGATVNQNLMTTQGPIVIPPQALNSAFPLLASGTGAVVTLANDNVVSGLYIQNANGHGILGSGVNNAIITNNYIQGTSDTYSGIELDNVSGIVLCSGNQIIDQGSCVVVNNTNPVSNASYLFMNNLMSTFDETGFNFNISYQENSNNYFLSSQNTLLGANTQCLNILATNATANTPHIFDITNTNFLPYAGNCIHTILSNYSVITLNLNNSLINSESGINITTNEHSQATFNIANSYLNTYNSTIDLTTADSSQASVYLSNNVINANDSTISLSINSTSPSYLVLAGNAIITDTDAPLDITTGAGSSFNAVMSSNMFNTSNGTQSTINLGGTATIAIIDNLFNAESKVLQLTTTAPCSLSMINNSFNNQDGGSDNITWSIAGASPTFATFENNSFATGAIGLNITNGSTSPSSFTISNNTFTNPNGVPLTFSNTTADVGLTISDNLFQGFINHAATVTNTGGTMCLEFNDNISTLYPSAYTITGPGINLVPPQGNVGQITATGTTTVSSCD